ncbi:MAG: hypothetical protein JWO44_1695 [Bacteroidetes bacterium]|nr:hypothetical protein [Bacteroidota bacterium]
MKDDKNAAWTITLTIGLTTIASALLTYFILRQTISGYSGKEYLGWMYLGAIIQSFINSLTCLPSYFCLKEKVRGHNIRLPLSLFGLFALYNFSWFVVVLSNPKRVDNILLFSVPLTIFTIGQFYLYSKFRKNTGAYNN